jgi:hypothetical protein
VVADTGKGATVNVAEFEPCGIVTVDGIVTSGADADKAIEAPPLGVSDDNCSVQVELIGGATVVGRQENPLRVGG